MTMKKHAPILALGFALVLCGCSGEASGTGDTTDKPGADPGKEPEPEKRVDLLTPPETPPRQTEFAKDFPALKVTVKKEGKGESIPYGHLGRFHLVMTLSNGQEVQNTRKPEGLDPEPQPQLTPVMSRHNHRGLVMGIAGMKVGEVRNILIPPELGFGEEGDRLRDIPQNATLTVRAELVEIVRPMVRIYEEGTGPAIKESEVGSYHYTGVLARDGTRFDSSRGREPLKAPMQWPGPTIEAWYLGTQGMKVNERRWVYAPASLAYKEQGKPPEIGSNEDLIFEIELVEILPAGGPGR